MKNKKSKLIFIACVTIIISIIITADLYIKKSLPDNSILISKEEAEETAASYMNEIKKIKQIENTNIDIDLNTILRTEVKTVNPNYYWEDTFTLENKNPKKAYEITFQKDSGDFIGEASIWIDAETGENLGGEQTK